MAFWTHWRALAVRILAVLAVAWLVVGAFLYVRLRGDVREMQASWISAEWGEPYTFGEGYWPTPPRWQHLGGVGVARRHLGPEDQETVSVTALVCAADDAEALLERYRLFLVEQGFAVRRPRPDRLALEAERPGASASVRIGRPTWMGTRELTLVSRVRPRLR